MKSIRFDHLFLCGFPVENVGFVPENYYKIKIDYVRGNNVGPFSRIVSTLFLEAKRDFKQKSNYNTPEATAKREAAKARKANAKKDKAPSGNETPNQQLSNDTVSQPNSIQALTVTATIQPDTLAHPRPSSSQQQERPPQFHRAWDNDSTDPTLSALKTSAPGVIQSAMDLLYSGGSSIWQQ
ncbi:hypothetical protein B566_EDAN002692 [Ephemera danica]|nr:hypothetical protein B566_EDAN002692 [Ephemera danica]